FFFSSRRRHTRFSRDWSSDVCSSDLGGGGAETERQADSAPAAVRSATPVRKRKRRRKRRRGVFVRDAEAGASGAPSGRPPNGARSEERRAGKERRTWRAPAHQR